MSTNATGPNATGLDQAEQLNSWMQSCQGGIAQWVPTLPSKPFRVGSPLRFPSFTRILGTACGPFTSYNPGCYVSPVAGYTGELAIGAPLLTNNPWSHGTILEGIGFINDGQASVGLRFTGGEVSAIRDCAFTNFAQAGIKLVGGSAPFFAENLSVYGNGYGIWTYNAAGAMCLLNLSGDDDGSILCVENSDDDPNHSGGRILAITIVNLKTETGNYRSGVAADASNAPVILCIRPNETSIAVLGGVLEDWGGSGIPRNKAIVHIAKPDASARSAHVSLANIHADNYQYAVVDDVLGMSKDIRALTTWPGFEPIYHDHRITRTSTP